jgi:hypothetical protein
MEQRKSDSKEGKGGDSPSRLIDARIEELSFVAEPGGR